MQHYVVGFMFGHDFGQGKRYVATIRKIKPDWQRGLLNGIGGKINTGEAPGDAMSREFFEETGVVTPTAEWQNFARLILPEAVIFFFAMSDESDEYINAVSPTTAEETVVLEVRHFLDEIENKIPNLNWLVPMALEFLKNPQSPFDIRQTGVNLT